MMAHLKSIRFRYHNEQFARMAQRTVELFVANWCSMPSASPGLVMWRWQRRGINVKANRVIRLLPPVESVRVSSHGDGGLALGAAVAAAAIHASMFSEFRSIGSGPRVPRKADRLGDDWAKLPFPRRPTFQTRG